MRGTSSWLSATALFLPIMLSAQPIAVSGTVIEPDTDQVLAGVQVTLTPIASGRPAPEARGVTDRDGTFRLEAPAPGLWRLTARAKGRLPMTVPLVPLVEETFLAPLDLPTAASRRVTLRDSDGRPVPGARWLAVPEPASRPKQSPSTLRDVVESQVAEVSGTTGEDGAIELPCKDSLRWRLVAVAEGLAPRAGDLGEGCEALVWDLAKGAERTVQVVAADGKPREGVLAWLGGLPVGGPSGEEGNLSLRFEPSSAFRWTLEARDGSLSEADSSKAPIPPSVWCSTLEPAREIAGRVLAADPYEPLPGAVVWLEGAGARPGFVRTDQRGKFRLAASPGEVKLRAAAPGFVSEVLPSSRLIEPDLTLALRAASSIEGIVVDRTGVPIPDAFVAVEPEPDDSTVRTRSGADGRFRITGLAPQSPIVVSAAAPGFLGEPVLVDLSEKGRPTTGLRLVLKAFRGGFGRVLDSEGRPVEGAEISLSSQHSGDGVSMTWEISTSTGPARSGPDGRFHVEILPPSERFQLVARAHGFVPAAESIHRADGDSGPMDLGTLRLEPSALVSGRVTDRAGRPIADAIVQGRVREGASQGRPGARASREASVWVTTDEQGLFQVTGLPRGSRVSLWVKHPDYLTSSVQELDAPRVDPPLEVVLEPGARLVGRVVDDRGRPIAKAQIRAVAQSEHSAKLPKWALGVFKGAWTDEEGRFEVKALAPGSYTLRAFAESYVEGSSDALEVAAVSRVEVPDLVLARGVVLEGRVLDEGGRPVVGAWVGDPDRPPLGAFPGEGAVVDSQGRYRWTGLAPGSLKVTAGASGWLSAEEVAEIGPEGGQLDFTLRRGATVRGRVLDGDGTPLPQVEVDLREEDGGAFQTTARSGWDGAFSIEGVPPGRFEISASSEGFVAPREPASVEVAADSVEGLELVLKRGGAILGTIAGIPPEEAAGLEVSVVGSRGVSGGGVVDAGGRFRVEGLGPGTYRVLARSGKRNLAGSTVVELPDGAAETVVTLPLEKGLVLSLQLLSETAPVGRVFVRIEGEGLHSAWLADEGRFTLAGLLPGPYRMTFTPLDEPRAKNYFHSLTLDSDQTLDLDLSQLPRAQQP